MLKPRIIPCLLLKNGGLVKTEKFKNEKYVGDPINAVKIFNDKEVDELIILDIDRTKNNLVPDFELIEKISSECRMPLCYGGGIKSVDSIEKIISLGVEKVALNSIFSTSGFKVLESASKRVGSQSLVGVIDYKRKNFFNNNNSVFTHKGKNDLKISPVDFAKKLEDSGAGEIFLNSIEREGSFSGYDLETLNKVRLAVNIPITICGGASNLNDFKKTINSFEIIGLAAGSMFVFNGRFKAVLISYPTKQEKNSL